MEDASPKIAPLRSGIPTVGDYNAENPNSYSPVSNRSDLLRAMLVRHKFYGSRPRGIICGFKATADVVVHEPAHGIMPTILGLDGMRDSEYTVYIAENGVEPSAEATTQPTGASVPDLGVDEPPVGPLLTAPTLGRVGGGGATDANRAQNGCSADGVLPWRGRGQRTQLLLSMAALTHVVCACESHDLKPSLPEPVPLWCQLPDLPPDPVDVQNPCCQERSTPGCPDKGVADCVCKLYQECCARRWDEYCAETASARCLTGTRRYYGCGQERGVCLGGHVDAPPSPRVVCGCHDDCTETHVCWGKPPGP